MNRYKQSIDASQDRRQEPSLGDAPNPAPDREQVAKAAYLRWLEHGGDEKSNWLAAESELRPTRGRREAAGLEGPTNRGL